MWIAFLIATVGFIALGLFLVRGYAGNWNFLFYRRYEPRPMFGLLCLVIGGACLVLALSSYFGWNLAK
jgi:hypothetical protein